jgi:hypothetical protein
MKLVDNWKTVLLKAWSIRLLFLAGLLSGIEAALPFVSGAFGLDPAIMSLLTFGAVAAAFVARLVAQKAFSDEA